MASVLIISSRESKIAQITSCLEKQGIDVEYVLNEDGIFDKIDKMYPDLLLLDYEFSCQDITMLAKKIKINTQTENIFFTLLIPQECDNQELLKCASSYLIEPINEKILISTIMSNIRMKNSLEVLSKNNADLAKSLYQLDVLYNTSSQFAGSLNKENLIDFMLEGLEKSLSFNLSYTLLFNSNNNIKLIVNSLHPLSSRFEEAIKLRAMLSYKSLFEKKEMPYDISLEKINIERRIKHPYVEYDLPVLNFDNMFAPITIGDKFFGVIEVFREEDFKSEDATCFQTLSKQVSIPLETAVLYEEIKQTNAKLENLERMKSDFISIVSHELRTPLTAIKNSLEILQSSASGENTPVMDKFLGLAKRNVVRLAGIINDLLDLSKVEAGKMEFRFEKANIKQPIEMVRNTLENLAKEKNINLKLEVFNELPLLYIDPSRIEQVLTNLISNAIKFTPENGDITINVAVQNGLMNNNININKDYVLVSVKDSGIGIEEENLSKVFDKFQQIESSLSRKVGGTGLGLPIAKQLVEAHKGLIWVESIINQGATFTFAIPVLSDREIFNQDLEKQINVAKSNNYQLGLVKIKENSSSGFINDLISEEVSIIRKTSNVKSHVINNDESREFYLLVSQIDRYAINFVGKKIESILNSDETKYSKCDILYSTALYPEDGSSLKGLIDKLNADIVEIKTSGENNAIRKEDINS